MRATLRRASGPCGRRSSGATSCSTTWSGARSRGWPLAATSEPSLPRAYALCAVSLVAYRQGDISRNASASSEALEILQAVGEEGFALTEAHLQVGNAALALGDFDSAEASYEHAIESIRRRRRVTDFRGWYEFFVV